MSHLHIPDGILPPALWIAGLVLMAVLLLWSARATRQGGPQRIAFQSALGAIMLAVMAIPMPITGFDYCMTLAGPIGVLLGAAGGLQVAFVVTAILALMGQGGFTVMGLNTVVLGLGIALARPLYGALVGWLKPAGAMAMATAVSQLISSLAWIALLYLSVRMTPNIAGEHEVREGLQFLRGGVLVAVLLPMLSIAILIEALIAFGVGRFLAQVRPDLLPQPAAPQAAATGATP